MLRNIIIIGACVCASGCIAIAAGEIEKPAEKTFIGEPFWSSKIMKNEPVLFVQKKDEQVASGKLLFVPSGKLKITHPDLTMTYEEGKDYIWNPQTGVIELTPTSRIPFKTSAQLTPGGGPNTLGGLLWSEGHFFHDLQVQVTYEHADEFAWKPAPLSQPLTRCLAKLKRHEPFKLVTMGDSITEGYNASGFKKVWAPPYQPNYAQLVANTLEKRFGTPVALVNLGIACTRSSLGFSQLDILKAEKPDLITIAFGMNHGEPAPAFEEAIRKLLAAVQASVPEADVVLVASMTQRLPADKFCGYRDVLSKMVTANVALADVTTPWIEVLKKKSFSDISGNNFNHPNDFGHRLYAQVICQLLPEGFSQASEPALEVGGRVSKVSPKNP